MGLGDIIGKIDGALFGADATGGGRRMAACLWPALALLALLALAYCRVGSLGFIWDDDSHILENGLLRSTQGLAAMWTNYRAFPQFYPMTLTTFWVEYRLYGFNPLGYHLANLALHGANCLLLWTLLRRLKVPGAWLCAAVFAVHPVHVESVAWITERKNVLSGFFYLSSALAYLTHRERRKGGAGREAWLWWGGSLALFILAFLSKSVTATLPAALLLVAWWKEGRIERREVAWLTPFFALGIGFGLFAAYMESAVAGANTVNWGLTPLDRFLLAGRVAWSYPLDLLAPVNQAFFRPKWVVSASDPLAYLGLLALILALYALWRFRGKIGRGPLAGALYYLGTVFPVLGFLKVFPMQFSWVADHFQYLASIGTTCLFVAALLCLVERLKTPAARAAARLALIPAVTLPLAALAIAHTPVFTSEETLWKDTIAKSPDCAVAYRNLGHYYFRLGGRFQDVVYWTDRAAERGVVDDGMLVNAGEALASLGRIDDAFAYYQRAATLNPANAKAALKLGLIYRARDNYPEAKRWLKRAVDANPRDAKNAWQLGMFLVEKGDVLEARRYLTLALQADPNLMEARRALLKLDGR